MQKLKDNTQESRWFAIKTRQDFRAEEMLRTHCDEVFFPKEIIRRQDRRQRVKAAIPHVLFIKTDNDTALRLEKESNSFSDRLPVSFWIYRYPQQEEIQVIPQRSIDLLRLLTAEDATKCEIFNKTEFAEKDHVRVTDGMFKDYTGYVQRVRKNQHVVVEIEGICMVMLPFIHPSLLQKIN